MSTSEDEASVFIDAVRRAREYIAAGDIYQANLSRNWSVEVEDTRTAAVVYAALCDANPAPFAGLVRWQDTCIISSSPERLVADQKRRGGDAPDRRHATAFR